MSEKTNNDSAKRILIIVLLIISIVAIGVTVWALFFRNSSGNSGENIVTNSSDNDAKVLTPDYAPKDLEENAEPIGDENDEKLSQAEGGGAVSLTYSKDVSINLETKSCSLLFGNPTRSNQDMVVQIVVQDTVIVQSGRLQPGNKVTTLSLEEGAESQLEAGGYEGKIVVLYYQQDTGEKAIVNTEIPVTITVTAN